MDIQFQNSGQWQADCVLLFLFQGADLEETTPHLWYSRPWIDRSPALRDFSGKKDELALLYSDQTDSSIRVCLVAGLGKQDDLTLENFRKTVAKAVAEARKRGFDTLGLAVESLEPIADALNEAANAFTVAPCLSPSALPYASPTAALTVSPETLIKEAACAALLSLYRLDEYRSKPEEDAPADPAWLAFLCTEQETPTAMRTAAMEGAAEAKGVTLAQNLANAPANYITPTALAAEAKMLALRHGFSCAVFGPEEILSMEMGAFWAVAKGSKEEPRLIVLEHCPEGKENDQPLVLVGKGITFDSGGISLKPPAHMHEMKSDMGGAAAVMGFFEALGGIKDEAANLPRVVGIIPATENMPSGSATRPGDVVRTMSGKTVEILNTDAEGRLILCDALCYAQKNWHPSALIDAATLTGACVVALGDHATGVFSDDEALRRLVMESAAATGDLCWPLPLWKEYDANIKSDVADMANMGPREGGAIHAALFLKRFIEKGTRWVHLDIAGPGYVSKASPLHPMAGATGVGVRLFCRLHRDIETL